MRLDDHPTVRAVRAKSSGPRRATTIDAEALRRVCLEAGADDVGFVSVETPELAEDLENAREALPGARSYVAFVCRMNRGSVRSPLRSLANLEFHEAGDHVDDVARGIVRHLEDQGFGAVNPSVGFPQEMSRFPGRAWVIQHKPIAVAAGLGHMGIHRSVIHPRFGSFVLLGTVITDAEISSHDAPIDYNPCLECKLCVAACPVGAISKDGEFDFQACYTHNYREFMSGFTDWAQTVADSRDAADYRARVTDSESASMWQSLAFRPNYKAAYCMAVCPAGEDVIGPYLEDRRSHLRGVVKPLQQREEVVYVVPGSHAEEHASKRFPHKEVRQVDNGLPDEINEVLAATSPYADDAFESGE